MSHSTQGQMAVAFRSLPFDGILQPSAWRQQPKKVFHVYKTDTAYND